MKKCSQVSKIIKLAGLLFGILLAIPFSLYAFDNISFFDKDDSMLDLSDFLSTRYGFIPVPIIITEPAVGYGGGFALAFLHDNFAGRKSKSGRNVPPSISGIFLAGTENDTKFAGAFHLGHYFEDNLRSQTFYLYADVNIDFYTKNDTAISTNIITPVFYQSLKLRLFDSKIFLGAAYFYTKSDVSIDNNVIDFPSKDFKVAYGGLIFDYDSRDNTISPNKGNLFNLRLNFYDKALASDYEFQRYLVQDLFYFPITDKFNFDQRFSYEQLSGNEAPFYMYPAVFMRGVPAMRYQGEKSAIYEAQLSWNFNSRWRFLGFIGLAKVFGKTNGLWETEKINFNEADTIFSRGVGFRYLIAKKFGLRVGIDFANTDEGSAIYIQVGTAWIGF
jgi:outer membrane protein assembly factor BamA